MSSKTTAQVQLTAHLAPDVVDSFPQLRVALIAAPNEAYADEDDAARAAVRVFDRVLSSQGTVDLADSETDLLYRAFYQSMGLKAAQVSNPVKQAARVLRNGSYHGIAPLIDVAMEIEYSTLVSFQLYGLPETALTYELASGTEPIVTARGEDKICKTGELILRTSGEVLHSCYYGNSRAHMLRPHDDIALVRIMAVPGISDEVFADAIQQAIQRMRAFASLTLDATHITGPLTPNGPPATEES